MSCFKIWQQPDQLNRILSWSLASRCYGTQIEHGSNASFFLPEGKAIHSHIPRKMSPLSSSFWEYRCAHSFFFFFLAEVCTSENHFSEPSKCGRKCTALCIDSVNLWLANLSFCTFPEKPTHCFYRNIKGISELDSIYFLIFLPCPGWKMTPLDHHQ